MIRVETGADHVCRITLDRPGAKNALTVEMRDGIVDAVRAGRADPAVRALLDLEAAYQSLATPSDDLLEGMAAFKGAPRPPLHRAVSGQGTLAATLSSLTIRTRLGRQRSNRSSRWCSRSSWCLPGSHPPGAP